MRYLVFILFLVLNSSITSSQELKTDTIKVVSIVEKKVIQYTTSSQVIDPKITQYYQHSSLQNLLQMHTNVFVKNYGVGNLSTISIRGSSAAQTQVLWNGVNINNALTGMSDFSSIPISFFDNIRIDYGGQDKNLALGGAVHLLNETPRFYSTNKYNVSFGYESLQNAGLVFGANLSRKRFYQRLKININQSRNKYSFFNPDKKVESELEHADSKQINVLSDSYFKLSSHANVSLHLWGQFQNREIPPASFEDTSAKEEKISSFRSIIKFEKQKFNFYGLSSSLGFFYEDYQYADSMIQLKTKSDVITIPFQMNLNYKFGRRHHLYIQAFAQNSFIASSSALSLHKAGLIVSYQLDPIFKRLSIRANLQKEVTNVFSVPMIGSLITYLDMFKGGRAYVSLSTNYRMPTLNELYYSPGGNINLKPETSKNIEGGFNLSRNKFKTKWHLDMAIYNRQVKNWIIWYGGAIFTPHNIQRVWSRGLEFVFKNEILLYKKDAFPKVETDVYIIKVTDQLRDSSENLNTERQKKSKASIVKLITGLLYTYSLSTTEESNVLNDFSIGKQIPYVPRYQAKANIGIQWNSLSIEYIQTYTGYRFVTTDESQYLKPFTTGNLLMSYQFNFKQHSVQGSFRFNNLFNENYESIVGRVMPRRNMSLGLRFDIR